MDDIKKLLANKSMERYKGFIKPNTTPTPDDLFDLFLHDLSGAELKVILYIIRRTYGFQKNADSISIKQLVQGIVDRSGNRLDYGTGLTKKTAIAAVRSLESRGLISVERAISKDGDNTVNIYKLRFR